MGRTKHRLIQSGRLKRKSPKAGSTGSSMASPPLPKRLKGIAEHDCTRCGLHRKAKTVCVAGDGQARIPVLVLGEAPGGQEDSTGRPFVGAAGRLLRAALAQSGLHPNSVWLTNAAKCFPHGTPTADEIDVCSSVFLRREFEILKPAWVLALGKSACLAVCEDPEPITKMRGQIYPSKNFGGVSALVFPTFHPAYIWRNRGTHIEQTWRKDLEAFSTIARVDLGLYGDQSDELPQSEPEAAGAGSSGDLPHP